MDTKHPCFRAHRNLFFLCSGRACQLGIWTLRSANTPRCNGVSQVNCLGPIAPAPLELVWRRALDQQLWAAYSMCSPRRCHIAVMCLTSVVLCRVGVFNTGADAPSGPPSPAFQELASFAAVGIVLSSTHVDTPARALLPSENRAHMRASRSVSHHRWHQGATQAQNETTVCSSMFLAQYSRYW